MNSQIYGARRAYCVRQPIDSGSTPNQTSAIEHPLLAQPQSIPFDPTWVEDELLDSLIKNRVPAIIFTINKYQEHVLIHAHDNQVILATSQISGSAKLIYKHAVSTIGVDSVPNGKAVQSANPQFLSNFSELESASTSLEKLFLDKLITDDSEVNIVITSGFQTSGIITEYDKKVIAFSSGATANYNIMYKHAISTITVK